MTKQRRRRNDESNAKRFKNFCGGSEIFYMLCFALCSPQVKTSKNRVIQQQLVQVQFFERGISRKKLEELLKPLRFWRMKAGYLANARKIWPFITAVMGDPTLSWEERRHILVRNVHGLGMKTASMFLQWCGAPDFAVLDVHVLRYLGVDKLRGRKHYLELEQRFRQLAAERGTSTAVLDEEIWLAGSGEDQI